MDVFKDLLIGGNYHQLNLRLGRFDALRGMLLLNSGKSTFKVQNNNLLNSTGEVWDIQKVRIGDSTSYLFAINNDSLKILDQRSVKQNIKD